MNIRLLLKHIAIALTVTCITTTVLAQTNIHKQVLVFLKDGTTDIFYSDKIKTIELSKFDADEIEHTDFVSHLLIFADGSSKLYSIEDVDSVTFGSKTYIEPKKSVRRLTDAEVAFIKEFTSNQLVYSRSTSSDIIPSVGEIVYYDKMSDLMPYGLCAKINGVTVSGDKKVVAIEYIDPQQVFDKFFVTETDDETTRPKKVPRSDLSHSFKIELPTTEKNGIKGNANIQLTVSVDIEDAVVNVLSHYYHAKLLFSVASELNMGLHSEAKTDGVLESKENKLFTIAALNGLLTATLRSNLFIEALAEMNIDYNLAIGSSIEIEWTCKNGVNTFSIPSLSLGNNSPKYSQNLDTTIDGFIFGGPELTTYLGVLFDRAGAGASFKIGPHLSAEFSLGLLQELQKEYSLETYGKAKLNLGLGFKSETFLYNREHILFGDINKHKLPFNFEKVLFIREINLIPEFRTRSTFGNSNAKLLASPDRSKAIDVSSLSYTELPKTLPMGYELVDKTNDNVLSQHLNDDKIVEAFSTDKQLFEDEFVLTDSLSYVNPDYVYVRPVFKYADCVLKGAPSMVATNPWIQPIIYSQQSKGVHVISGMASVSQTKIDDTAYIVGNLLPTSAGSQFKRLRTANAIDFVEEENADEGNVYRNLLLGTWLGDVDGCKLHLTFNDETSGICDGKAFTYLTNKPLTGGVLIKFEDGCSMSFYVYTLTEDFMEIRGKNNKRYVFHK